MTDGDQALVFARQAWAERMLVTPYLDEYKRLHRALYPGARFMQLPERLWRTANLRRLLAPYLTT